MKAERAPEKWVVGSVIFLMYKTWDGPVVKSAVVLAPPRRESYDDHYVQPKTWVDCLVGEKIMYLCVYSLKDVRMSYGFNDPHWSVMRVCLPHGTVQENSSSRTL